ncbi:MAG: hypothetical protein IPK68_21095 [Bdellovibrionales bacterium]|nr:hypothetical protein [Bdellovibrionales bacterium]
MQLKDKVDNLLICNQLMWQKTGEQKLIFAMLFTWPRNSGPITCSQSFNDTSHWMEIRTTVSGYLDIVEEIVRFKNRLKAVFRAEAIQADENSFYKNKTRIKELENPSAKFVAEKLFDQIEFWN